MDQISRPDLYIRKAVECKVGQSELVIEIFVSIYEWPEKNTKNICTILDKF